MVKCIRLRFYPYAVVGLPKNIDTGQRRSQNFSGGGGGGKRRIQYSLDKIKPYSCNQDFAKRFEPKVNMTLLKKSSNLGGMLSKQMQFKCIMDGGQGAKPPVTGQFLQFLEKNNHFNVIWISFRTF